MSVSAGYGYYDYNYGSSYGSGYYYDPSGMYYYNGASGLTYYSYSYYDSHSKQKFSKDVVVKGSLDGYAPASQCPNGCLINGVCGSKSECESANFVVLIVFCVIGGVILLAVIGICVVTAISKKPRQQNGGMNEAPLLV